MKGSQKRKEVMPNVVIKKKFEFIRDRRYIFNVLVKTGLFILCMYLIFSYSVPYIKKQTYSVKMIFTNVHKWKWLVINKFEIIYLTSY